MDQDKRRLELVRLHKRWADRYLLIWIAFILVLFAGLYLVLGYLAVPTAERTDAFLLLATVMLAGTIWQAMGAVVARTDMLIRGLDID